MPGLLLAIASWGVWYLSPDRIELLAYNRQAILGGEWWRLWSVYLTYSSQLQLMIEASAIALLGLMLHFYVRSWHLILGLLFAMPAMSWLLLTLEPSLVYYRGGASLVALMWMLVTWFLIVEYKRLSFHYLLGQLLLLIAMAKVGFESWLLFFSHRPVSEGLRMAWELDVCGLLFGVALFNAFHQVYKGRLEQRKRPPVDQYGRPVPVPLNQYQLPPANHQQKRR
ncbi:MAG: hypothetical protein CO187_09550 [Zetaproteobacteria bacterium CG_4_9_14_3_um_filter_53_7]|nr:MAG: hypothetical protein CO187_09550 [Zetaproteobacteria bacterium CG_4_9_14_3_um_filter_53_7]